MERAEHGDAGQTGPAGDVGRFRIANFADHHHVRVLPQHAAECFDKSELDAAVDLDLVDAFDPPLDGVLNCAEALGLVVKHVEASVHRRALAGTDGPDAQNHAVGGRDASAELGNLRLVEAEVLDPRQLAGIGHQAEHETFAVNRRAAADADIALLFEHGVGDMPVLREAAFRDVHIGHQFDAGDDVRGHLGGQLGHVVQEAVDAEPHSQSRIARVEVDVGRLQLKGPLEQQIDKRSRSDDVDQLPKFFLQGFLANAGTFTRSAHLSPFRILRSGVSNGLSKS